MILAECEADRRAELEKLLVYQRQGFAELFKIMAGHPVTIRLLDPPLHEFLPESEEEMVVLAKETGADFERVRARVNQLIEVNPMLGHRGCRLGTTYPEIYEMQDRAIFEAASTFAKDGKTVLVEVMIPLVAMKAEFDLLAKLIEDVAAEVRSVTGMDVPFQIGTMIELPRSALRVGEIAKDAAFVSFGTNDLTQTTFGLSRDDSGKFLNDYLENKIFSIDPFISIDDGVGDLIEIAVEKGRKQNKKIKLGICGEHGGDPKSIHFCANAGLDYVSCSPYRVPIARLAAAQAELSKKN